MPIEDLDQSGQVRLGGSESLLDAQVILLGLSGYGSKRLDHSTDNVIELRHEKTCLRDLRPGKTNRPAQPQQLALKFRM